MLKLKYAYRIITCNSYSYYFVFVLCSVDLRMRMRTLPIPLLPKLLLRTHVPAYLPSNFRPAPAQPQPLRTLSRFTSARPPAYPSDPLRRTPWTDPPWTDPPLL